MYKKYSCKSKINVIFWNFERKFFVSIKTDLLFIDEKNDLKKVLNWQEVRDHKALLNILIILSNLASSNNHQYQ